MGDAGLAVGAFGDAVSRVRLRGEEGARRVLASCWDGSLALCDGERGHEIAKAHRPAALLDCCWAGAGPDGTARAACGGLDRTVWLHDFASAQGSALGSHDAPVRCVAHLADRAAVVSGGWDARVRVWDPRKGGSAVAECQEPGKVFSMDVHAARGLLLVAHAGRTLRLYDVRDLSKPLEQRDSALQYQTRVVRFFPDGNSFALGCIAGRVLVDSLLPVEAPGRLDMFKFKCHRDRASGRIFPVNALAFHPSRGTFATGGGDGTASVFDPVKRKRVGNVTGLGNPVAALEYSADGRKLAIAVSYTFEEGEQPARDRVSKVVLRDS